jgi:hypothetical protein
MSDTFKSRCISNTTKSTGMKNPLIRNVLNNSYWIAERLIG